MISCSHWGQFEYEGDIRITYLTGPMPPLVPWWRDKAHQDFQLYFNEVSYDARYLHG